MNTQIQRGLVFVLGSLVEVSAERCVDGWRERGCLGMGRSTGGNVFPKSKIAATAPGEWSLACLPLSMQIFGPRKSTGV